MKSVRIRIKRPKPILTEHKPTLTEHFSHEQVDTTQSENVEEDEQEHSTQKQPEETNQDKEYIVPSSN